MRESLVSDTGIDAHLSGDTTNALNDHSFETTGEDLHESKQHQGGENNQPDHSISLNGLENQLQKISFSDMVKGSVLYIKKSNSINDLYVDVQQEDLANSIIVRLFGKSIGYKALMNRIKALWNPLGNLNLIDLDNEYYLVCLPYRYYTRNLFGHIAGAIGKVDRIDFNTEDEKRGPFVRLAIVVDLNKSLIYGIIIDGQRQTIEYEGLPMICYTSGKYGHSKKATWEGSIDTKGSTAINMTVRMLGLDTNTLEQEEEKKEEGKNEKKKNDVGITLKYINEHKEDSSEEVDDEDEEMVKLLKKFKRFMSSKEKKGIMNQTRKKILSYATITKNWDTLSMIVPT
ncbi:hypothetical protein F3Y22_tig00111957pilonHSYRG00019 [Hibiscus syriacus]|uniref:DUF4283 domain-containing protein n=1 Tax=Hibiscus syriacus TaxID=106335 RepID=A0A6A2X8N2_HIBSY|nr:hypothetical protein F3Y22_tig00111957pilonHSYRG00019 [Hibiscus syriacus]